MEPFIGQIMLWPLNWAPVNWAECNGQLLPISQNTALFALIGCTYGGDCRTTLGLPDLRGRCPLGIGYPSPYSLGQRAGCEQVTLPTREMPPHVHTVTPSLSMQVAATLDTATTDIPSSTVHLAKGGTKTSAPPPMIYSSDAPNTTLAGGEVTGEITCKPTGNGQAFLRRQPYLPINYIIALTGLFPSRN